jgi:hypothetical protein
MENPTETEKALHALTREIRKANKLHNVFVRGIVMGVGTAIGATVVGAIVIAILTSFFHFVGIDQLFL